jgi:hypothetical protein
MIRLEALVLAIGKMNGAWDDPESLAFRLCNPLLLKTYRPEKKVDSDYNRVFTSVMGGFRAGVADLQAKSSGKNNRLSTNNTLRDLLALFGFKNDATIRKIVLFLRRALQDESVSANTELGWFTEIPQVENSLVGEGEQNG